MFNWMIFIKFFSPFLKHYLIGSKGHMCGLAASMCFDEANTQTVADAALSVLP